jgi:hypothetical protein
MPQNEDLRPYVIAAGGTLSEVQIAVCVWWKEGYIPHGSLVCHIQGGNMTYIQPMVLDYGEGEEEEGPRKTYRTMDEV